MKLPRPKKIKLVKINKNLARKCREALEEEKEYLRTGKLPELSERQIMNQCLDWLNWNGYIAWRNNTGAMKLEHKGKTRLIKFGMKGMSDILGFKKKTGKFIAIEVKRPSTLGKVTQAQSDFLNLVNEFGGVGIVVSSADDMEELL